MSTPPSSVSCTPYWLDPDTHGSIHTVTTCPQHRFPLSPSLPCSTILRQQVWFIEPQTLYRYCDLMPALPSYFLPSLWWMKCDTAWWKCLSKNLKGRKDMLDEQKDSCMDPVKTMTSYLNTHTWWLHISRSYTKIKQLIKMSSLDFIASCFIAALLAWVYCIKKMECFPLPHPNAQIRASCKNMSVNNFGIDLQVRFLQWIWFCCCKTDVRLNPSFWC